MLTRTAVVAEFLEERTVVEDEEELLLWLLYKD